MCPTIEKHCEVCEERENREAATQLPGQTSQGIQQSKTSRCPSKLRALLYITLASVLVVLANKLASSNLAMQISTGEFLTQKYTTAYVEELQKKIEEYEYAIRNLELKLEKMTKEQEETIKAMVNKTESQLEEYKRKFGNLEPVITQGNVTVQVKLPDVTHSFNYSGKLTNGVLYGYGTLSNSNGTKITGEIVKGKFEGFVSLKVGNRTEKYNMIDGVAQGYYSKEDSNGYSEEGCIDHNYKMGPSLHITTDGRLRFTRWNFNEKLGPQVTISGCKKQIQLNDLDQGMLNNIKKYSLISDESP